MKSKKNLFAAVLSLLLIFTFVPVTAFAAEADADLYPLEIWIHQDASIWFDGEPAGPADDGDTYYIPAGTIVRCEWDVGFLHGSSDFTNGESWFAPGELEFEMPERSIFLFFANR